MSGQAAKFCTACGAALEDSARFCTACGAPTAAPSSTSVAGALRTVQQAASYAGMAAALPWQTVVSGERPDLGAFLKQAGAPLGASVAHTVIRRSIRRPAVALLFTTLLDALVTLLSGQPAALSALLLRVVMGSGTGLLGVLVGKRGGFGRALVGVGSVATAVLQLYNAGAILLAGVQAGAGWLSLLPSLVSTVSVIVVAIKTVVMAFRKASR